MINTEKQYNSELSYGRGYVYSLQYHIVWCTKYRKPVLINEIESFLKMDLSLSSKLLGIAIIEMECTLDHIHLLVECSPQHFIPTVVKILKGNSARHIFMEYPYLKAQLWGGHLWNPSYFVATVSDTSNEQIKEYIQSQKLK